MQNQYENCTRDSYYEENSFKLAQVVVGAKPEDYEALRNKMKPRKCKAFSLDLVIMRGIMRFFLNFLVY